MDRNVHPVDQLLPIPKLLTLGLQHVLVMYAGAVAVPLILGRALKLSPEDVAFLISADLFACGLATLVQSVGLPGVGIRLPVMMGVTFASVGPMLSMAAAPDVGLLGIYGAVIAAGLFAILAAPFISRLLPLFPPVVTGTIILVIGVSLMRVGINWAGGGLPTLTKVVDGVPGAFPNPGYGQLQGLGIALFVLIVILSLIRWGSGFVANVSVLLGIVGGAVLASLIGVMHFDKVMSAAWFDICNSISVRHTAIPLGADRHDVHRDGGRDDRIGWNVSRALRNDRAQDRPSRPGPRTARGWCRHNAFTRIFVGVLGPGKGFWACIDIVEKTVNGIFELLEGSEHAAFEALFCEGGKQALDGIEPGGRRGGEVEHEPRMVLDPFHDIGMLVGDVVIDNDVDHLFLRHPGVDDV